MKSHSEYEYYFVSLQPNFMMLELHNVTIGQQIRGLSATVSEGNVLSIMGSQGKGKTTLLRVLLGFLPVDEGHVSIDGELLTPLSAPWFRKQMAYVPQHLSVPDGYTEVQTDYLWLLRRAVESGKPLLLVDEPPQPLNEADRQTADELLEQAVRRGTTVVAVNQGNTQNCIQL